MTPHKRYLVFEYHDYYPMGGINDCVASFDTEQECANFIAPRMHDCFLNWEVYDRIEGVDVEVKIEYV